MMIRQVLRSVFAVSALGGCGVLLAFAARASADPVATPVDSTTTGAPGIRITIDVPPATTAATGPISPIIFLDRCQPTGTHNCIITNNGKNDARNNLSMIPSQPTSTIGEFKNSAGLTGAAADAEWGQVVQCMKEVYSPFNVTVTDTPPDGVTYHRAIIAGVPTDIGFTNNQILGVAPLASDCSAIDNVISFSFANAHPAADRVLNICWTASQESAHAFGLDHEFEFADKRSACNDPMTYRNDCGGEKFFRNLAASCGETAIRACKCGASQNSHLKLLSVFGPGTPITGNPTVALTNPAMSGAALSNAVFAQAGSKRGVDHVDILFNAYKWTTVPGAAFGRAGQPNPSDYPSLVPAGLPNSIVDVQAIAYDDLGASTASPVVTVTKGAPCTSDSACATGQRCDAGKCFWDPPVGEFGDACAYPQFCKDGLQCTGTQEHQICTHSCVPGVVDSCDPGYECVMQTATQGVCFIPESGGCCSVDRSQGGWWRHLAIAALVLAYVMRRRRR